MKKHTGNTRMQYGTLRLLELVTVFCVSLVALVYARQFEASAAYRLVSFACEYSTVLYLLGAVGLSVLVSAAIDTATPLFAEHARTAIATQITCLALVVLTNLVARSYYADLAFEFPRPTYWALYYPSIHHVGLRALCSAAWIVGSLLLVTVLNCYRNANDPPRIRPSTVSQLAVGTLTSHVVLLLLPLATIVASS